MFDPFRSMIRISAFLRKEVVQVFRQPRLLVTLVFGPFVILLLFGIGYRDQGRVLRTLFVVQKGDPLEQRIRSYAPKLGSAFSFQGIAYNVEEARTRLRHGNVDLVVVAPAGAADRIRNNEQAVFKLYHNEIDPYQAEYVRFTGELYVNKLNRSLFTTAIKQQKSGIRQINSDLKDTIETMQVFRRALEAKNISAARQAQERMRSKVVVLGGSLQSEIAAVVMAEPAAREKTGELQEHLKRFEHNLQAIDVLSNQDRDLEVQAQRAVELQKDLEFVHSQLGELQKIDSDVLTSPFGSRAVGIAKAQPNLSQYYTPGVIILLLQHLAITFSALSLVREFSSGRAELYRISPVRSGEVLLGKYGGYLLVSYVVSAALTALLIYGLHVPMKGSWMEYFWIVSALLVTSLGAGFILSLLSTSEGQAIQYSMIFLLMSIFFTGFLLNLQMLWEPIRLVSWLLPATYGIRLMQDVMLRGESIDPVWMGLLICGGVLLFAMASRMLLRRWKVT